MKRLFFVAALAVATISANAQNENKPLTFSVGAEAHLPVGDWSDVYSVAFGGSVQAEYNLDEQLALTLNAGYLNFSGKDGWGSVGQIPVMGGIKYTFQGNIYAAAQLGASFSTESGGGTSFVYTPGIGYKFSPNFDALLKYQGWSQNSSNSGTVGLRLAYNF
ncbi:MAG TPA: outer membrane beta-barrel protein [Ferruginibacter sp.]|nr:outer membrane beta-barrel protein [Ferruginibacter sp.]HRE64166.1 outer membrane beta-barrel protein [Ferruginibacter sp.]